MTGIQWTDETWNPTTGCDQISPGCDNCYALTMAKRLKGMGQAKYQNDGDPRTSGPGFGLTVHPDTLYAPFDWTRKPRNVFVNSVSDLGHARIPREFLAKVWATMYLTPQHTYQILSKRPERLRAALAGPLFRNQIARAVEDLLGAPAEWEWPVLNVHLGTSVELDEYCRRVDDLRKAPAAVRFLSLEPLLGPLPSLRLDGIGWVIIGGESGAGARPMRLEWVRDIMARCDAAGVPVFVKQVGSVLGREIGAGAKGGDIEAFPEDLQRREFPVAAIGAAA
jgi:protein gp37